MSKPSIFDGISGRSTDRIWGEETGAGPVQAEVILEDGPLAGRRIVATWPNLASILRSMPFGETGEYVLSEKVTTAGAWIYEWFSREEVEQIDAIVAEARAGDPR